MHAKLDAARPIILITKRYIITPENHHFAECKKAAKFYTKSTPRDTIREMRATQAQKKQEVAMVDEISVKVLISKS